MADVFELSYVYARVCGAFARVVSGERAVRAASSGNLSELWRSVFGKAAPALPEAALLREAERAVIAESMEDFRLLVRVLRRDEPFFDALGRKAEYARVKRVIAAAASGAPVPPEATPGAAPGDLDDDRYPDLPAMFAGGRFAWIDADALKDAAGTENRLDRQYYEELWKAIDTVPLPRRGALRELVALEVELSNVVWAQRLARYYGFDTDAIGPLLVKLEGRDVVGEALRAVGFRRDAVADWTPWRWYRLLADQGAGSPGWSLDVRALETSARRHVYRHVRRALHLHPFTYTPLYCFFKIKEFEAATVLGLFEGVHLGAPKNEMAAYALAVTGGTR